ncbi:MAG: carboxypeptidase regulatory-like domain-containing protein [Gemmatimonadaceae bacterium]
MSSVAAAQNSARLHGVVFDSLSGKALAGADVQVLRADSARSGSDGRTATADQDGRYRIEGLAPGDYVVGFFHPTLDSLGLNVAPRPVTVAADADAQLDLAIPADRSVIRILCGEHVTDSSALVVGFVRDAATARPARDASVVLEWGEWVFRGGGVHEERQMLNTSVRTDGWYAFCNVPVTWVMRLRAARGADTSGAVDPALEAQKVAVRDLYVGPGFRAVRMRDATPVRELVVEETEVMWAGTARLAGVVRGVDGNPIAGARVRVAGTSAIATTTENGDFVLHDLPAGSQTLEARGIGYLPSRATVHLVPDSTVAAPAMALMRLKVFLDTVRVTATRLYSADVNGFEARLKSHVGHFVTREQIEKKQPFFTSDLLRLTPGVEVSQSAAGYFGRMVFMRAAFGKGVRSDAVRRRQHVQAKPEEVRWTTWCCPTRSRESRCTRGSRRRSSTRTPCPGVARSSCGPATRRERRARVDLLQRLS